MKKNLKPGIKSDYRKKLPLMTEAGSATGRSLAMPASIGPYEKFNIGSVRLECRHGKVFALDPIPESWFVNLTEDVPVEHGN